MASLIRASVKGLEDLARRLTNLVGLPVLVLQPLVAKYALKIQGTARRLVKVDQGVTRASIITAIVGPKGLSAEIGSNQKTAVWLEEGTRPHFPPPSALIPWVRRHGMPDSAAYPIARKIAQRGTPATPFLEPAFNEHAPNFVAEATEYLGKEIENNNRS